MDRAEFQNFTQKDTFECRICFPYHSVEQSCIHQVTETLLFPKEEMIMDVSFSNDNVCFSILD